MTGMTGPACRNLRQLLGVYVVGAIDPAERSAVEEHLASCPACREELAGLAGLPALLGRVPRAEAERLDAAARREPDLAQPSAELLTGLLGQVAAARRSRRRRSVVALAAAVAIAAGGTAAVVSSARPAASGLAAASVARASDAGLTALVRYSATPWGGSTMRVAVTGIPAGTTCTFWVVDAAGRRSAAATWTVSREYDQRYAAASPLAARQVHGFLITSGGRKLLAIPAS